MSRQTASKSRGEKGASRGNASVTQGTTVPVVTSDVVPGRVPSEAWKSVLNDESNNEFVGILIEEILDATMDECYKKYIEKQVLSYTVHHAQENLMQVIEWSFLPRDFGEDLASGGWTEETEPDPGVIDSWAQGSVPVVVETVESIAASITPIQEEAPEEEEEINLDTLPSEPSEPEPKPIEAKPPTEIEIQKEIIKTQGKKRGKYKRHKGRLRSAGLKEMEKTLLQSESEIFEREFSSLRAKLDDSAHLSPSQKSLLKLQAGRPPGNKEVTFDERGNVVGVMKLDVRSLPSHKVKVQYNIIDPEAEAAAQRLALMRTGKLKQSMKVGKEMSPRHLAPLQASVRQPRENYQPTPPYTQSTLYNNTKSKEKDKRALLSSYLRKQHLNVNARVEPLPPPLIHTIDASPGVRITEGTFTKTGGSKLAAMHIKSPAATPISRLGRENSMLSAIGVSSRPGGRSLRVLGTTTLSNIKEGNNLRPVLSPSDVVTLKNVPYVQSHFTTTQTNTSSASIATN